LLSPLVGAETLDQPARHPAVRREARWHDAVVVAVGGAAAPTLGLPRPVAWHDAVVVAIVGAAVSTPGCRVR
jgi:hypothetical protein